MASTFGSLETIGGAGITFAGSYGNGIVLSTSTTQNPATLAATGYVTNNGTENYGAGVAGIDKYV